MSPELTIQATLSHGLCVSCGVCAAVCPQDCISMRFERGQFLPRLDPSSCTRCGLCLEACPGIDLCPAELEHADLFQGLDRGEAYTAYARDAAIRRNGASGGVVTALITALVERRVYPSAFVVPAGRAEGREWFLESTADPAVIRASAQSKYLPVSAEKVLRACIETPDIRAIVVATPCVLLGIRKALSARSLRNEGLLYVGLFCDLTMNLNFLKHMERNYAKKGETLRTLSFRTKEWRGWPGDLALTFDSGRHRFVDRAVRTKSKPFFQLRRCLFCFDKLNTLADISCGDCYAHGEETARGQSSVIVRTPKGKAAWDAAAGALHASPTPVAAVSESQKLKRKQAHADAARILRQGIDTHRSPAECLRRLPAERRRRLDLAQRGADDRPVRPRTLPGVMARLAAAARGMAARDKERKTP